MSEIRYVTAPGAQPYAVPAQDEPARPRRTWRIFVLLGIALLAAMVACFPLWRGAWVQGNYSMSSLRLGMLLLAQGAGLYLLTQKGVAGKIFGGAALALCAVLSAMGNAIMAMGVFRPEAMFRAPQLVAALKQNLVLALGLGAVALVIGLADRQEKLRVIFRALILAGVNLLLGAFLNRGTFILVARGMGSAIYLRQVLFSLIVGTAVLLLAQLYCESLATLRRGSMKVSAGSYVWGTSVVVVSAMALVVAYFEAGKDAVTMLLGAVAIAGMIVLMCRQRVGFSINLAAVSALLYMNLYAGLLRPVGSSRTLMLIAALAGAVNPLITWLLLRKNWKN